MDIRFFNVLMLLGLAPFFFWGQGSDLVHTICSFSGTVLDGPRQLTVCYQLASNTYTFQHWIDGSHINLP